MNRHELMMSRAIELALKGRERTSPNPMVGAIVVKGGRIVGEGYHRKAGLPHAEIYALREARGKVRGATLYVTLEPCCFYGRTPPCTEAIIAAGVSRVVVGTRDPNPKVSGRGIRELKRAGVEVIEGILEVECCEMNRRYEKFISSGMPYVTAKVALTLDGKIATERGDSKWITNAACRTYVHGLRACADAVVVGSGTLKRDDPRLDVRLCKGREPLAVIVDSKLSVGCGARIFKRRPGRVIFASTRAAGAKKIRRIERGGNEVLICKSIRGGLVDIGDMLKRLASKGISSILLEGGGELYADFFRRKLVDRVVACIAPRVIGGGGMDFLPGISAGSMKKAAVLKDVAVRTFGDNVVIEGKMET